MVTRTDKKKGSPFLQSQPTEWDFLLPSKWLTCEFITTLQTLFFLQYGKL
jgi:hypothetical protein